MSQLGQDADVLQIFNTPGFFIEVGAFDGIVLSNTMLLEQQGWKGICIEADHDMYNKLKNTRKSTCVNATLWSSNDESVEFVRAGLYGGILSTMDTVRFKDKIDGKDVITVKTTTLTQVLDDCHAPFYIQYLSLDTEGSEQEILLGIDHTRYKFGLITVEHNHVEPRRTEIKNFLENLGYRFLKENGWDDYYLGKSDFIKFYDGIC